MTYIQHAYGTVRPSMTYGTDATKMHTSKVCFLDGSYNLHSIELVASETYTIVVPVAGSLCWFNQGVLAEKTGTSGAHLVRMTLTSDGEDARGNQLVRSTMQFLQIVDEQVFAPQPTGTGEAIAGKRTESGGNDLGPITNLFASSSGGIQRVPSLGKRIYACDGEQNEPAVGELAVGKEVNKFQRSPESERRKLGELSGTDLAERRGSFGDLATADLVQRWSLD